MTSHEACLRHRQSGHELTKRIPLIDMEVIREALFILCDCTSASNNNYNDGTTDALFDKD